MEVMISSFVLTIGLVAVTALIAKSLGQSLENRDTIVAVELAQEGIELVRNVRDNDFTVTGHNGFTPFSSSNRHCRQDYNDSSASLNCRDSSDAPSNNPGWYYLEYTGGLYEHTSTPSRFSRYIYIDYNQGQESALVRSFVYWGATVPPVSGASSSCTVVNKCVFTEVKLTSWKE